MPGEKDKIKESVGFDSENNRSASYFLNNNQLETSTVRDAFRDKIEMMDLKKAIEKYSWLKDYRWKAVPANKDEITQAVAENYDGGYFIRVLPNARVTLPLQSCMMISGSEYDQKVHNIIIVEENADVQIITGCVSHSVTGKAKHLGISEFFVKDNARLNFTMIHNWNSETVVRPRSAAKLGKNSHFISNYVMLNPVKDLKMYPVAYCDGENSRVSFNNLIYCANNSHIDTGSKIVLNGKNSRGEIISRNIAKDNSTTIARGFLEGNNQSKGHLECKGLLMGSKAKIHAIPEILSNTELADLSHEAAVGKIAEKEITYLMSRGLTEEQAISMIIRGFMDVSIFGLPEALNNQIKKIMDSVTGGF